MKPLLAFDLDDTLLFFSGQLVVFHNRYYGSALTMNDLVSYDLSKVWHCSPEECLRRIQEFYESPEHWDAIPIDGAVEVVQRMQEQYRLCIITAKPDTLSIRTGEWLMRHFNGMFESVHFTNQYQTVGRRRTKLEVCQELGVVALIEDHLDNAVLVSTGSIPVYLLDKPWNQGETNNLITRVRDWYEIEKRLKQ